MFRFGHGAPPTGSARMAPLAPLSKELLSCHVELLNAICDEQPVRHRTSVGAFGVLSTIPGSRAPPMRPEAPIVSVVPEIDPVNHPPVRLAAPKNRGPAGETPADAQNFDAEHQAKVDPSPAPMVCVCAALPSACKPTPSPSRVAERNVAGTPVTFNNS